MWKPGNVVELKEGYSISAFRGFVSFWNWIANFVFNMGGDGAIVLDDSSRGSPVLKLSGFESASDDTFPCKSGSGLTWKIPSGGGANLKFIGTDGSYAIAGDPTSSDFKTVTFASKSDSNVKVEASGSDGNVTLTIGVYWK